MKSYHIGRMYGLDIVLVDRDNPVDTVNKKSLEGLHRIREIFYQEDMFIRGR